MNRAPSDDPLARFALLVAQEPLPLLHAAAEAARYADPDCDPKRVLDTMARWGAQLAARLPADAAAPMRWRQLNHFFFDELGFRPNVDQYYDPDNSYLHRVIERRTGIPITLSLLYSAVGAQAGLKLQGVAFPGHFLVTLALSDGHMIIDVFGGGQALSQADLRARLAAARVDHETPLDVLLRPASEREILARLLRNLKLIHVQSGDLAAALHVQHRIVAVLPDAPEELRIRAALYERLECPRAAADDLAAYVRMQAGQAAAETQDLLQRLQQAARRLN